MDMPDMPVNVPVDDPNADTEWNDILRKKGIIPEKPPSPTPMIREALEQARQLAHENRLEGKDLDELDELEDDEDEDFLDSYRQKRMQELATLQNASVYNQVYPLQKSEWSTEVTEASSKAWVLVLLTSSSGTNDESRLMIELWRTLAKKFGDIKFCQIRGDLCIEGYPDRNCPTVLVYKDGDVKRQIVTLRELRGDNTAIDGEAKSSLRFWSGMNADLGPDLQQMLLELGALKHGDSRLTSHTVKENDAPRRGIQQSARQGANEEDSDFD